ncbi:hypothetical protein AVEN_84556-1 [Araneus ventricosus]|uniref:Uncharacterized protein n=1 Tax=Araneus ventricosus TaxID=182803 RepID=A0A4Y2L6D7_ARAVE|nr:hypothetical protein AVEN_84556-1 [Araneus ventricosus]
MLKTCTNSVIRSWCKCALNVPSTKREKNQLTHYKCSLRKLLDRRLPPYKRQLLIQRGEGFLPILLPAAISVISFLIDRVQYENDISTRLSGRFNGLFFRLRFTNRIISPKEGLA